MLSISRKIMILTLAILFFLGTPFPGIHSAFFGDEGLSHASVGSVAAGEDITYDKGGGVLKNLGFDTTKTPSTYDPDATTNPYGSDVSTLNEVEEIVRFDTSGNQPSSALFGHNKKLDGKYSTLMDAPVSQTPDFLKQHSYVSAAKCDLKGTGRDSFLALVYTHYNYSVDITDVPELDKNIYMRIYDPVTGRSSEPFIISHLDKSHPITLNYQIQSQLQITAGDYDKDSVDEIAVYAPATSDTERSKVVVFDLTDGKDCADLFASSSWRRSWNYVLPLSKEEIIQNHWIDPTSALKVKNVYNNLDLTSGDADNDGICDLVISYGASDTDAGVKAGQEQIVKRSIPSTSVLLYGNDKGQMLKDVQKLSYGDNSLIRVAFAFGDIDGDGNEDMFLGGQLQSEQESNQSRVLGKYVYTEESGDMELESLKNMQVVNGTWSDDKKTFYSANGWDGAYHSAPLMKANLVIGNIMGAQSDTKIYLDSVLYSYDDGSYDIVDELEDDSNDDSGNKPRGSCVFTNLKGYYNDPSQPSAYFEFDGDAGNFTGGSSDYFLINRMTILKQESSTIKDVEAEASILYQQKSDDTMISVNPDRQVIQNRDFFIGSPQLLTTVNTDKDSLIAKYTGQHKIVYTDPKVLAVLASAPYFKDVAAYDDGNMLGSCSTTYGKSNGVDNSHTTTFSCNVGGFVNSQIGTDEIHAIVNVGAGYCRQETWGYDDTRAFEISYGTAGGEDAVVLYSIPSENYIYELEGVTVDDDGNIETCSQTLMIAKPHKPVTQTLTLDDYMDIQNSYSEQLPDVTRYLTSTPGYPDTYPSSEDSIYKIAKDNLVRLDFGDEWSGIAYGSGSETQSLTYSHTDQERYKNVLKGGYFSFELGVGTSEDFLFFHSIETAFHFDFNQMTGDTTTTSTGTDFSGTVPNMPRAAKGYGYDFSWKICRFEVTDKDTTFPVVTYLVTDVDAPPELPENISQDFDNTTDSQIGLNWTCNTGNPLEFQIYRYEDFPQGGGDTLIGKVKGSDYRIRKDENGNTIKDQNGHVVREYSFQDTDLTADTKYRYRVKVFSTKLPGESIFSPVIEARTFVGTKPNLTLSADNLTIYPDNTYDLLVKLEDPEHYQKNISYQWQRYDDKKRKWNDVEGCTKEKLQFYNCSDADEGKYRCRVNLIRKVESHPQYITAYTDPCTVHFSLRNVGFGGIQVSKGSGNAQVNTRLSVKVFNDNPSSLEKPTGVVTFTITGPNGTFQSAGTIDENTGIASVDSIEDRLSTLDQKAIVDGGYLITARYEGSGIFYPADDPEDYHYLRNIDDSMFLSVKSVYCFGDDVAADARLLDYKKDTKGKISCEELTDKLTTIRFYQVDGEGNKTGDAVATCNLSTTKGKALVPLDKKLAKKAYVEAYMEGKTDPVAGALIITRKIEADITLNEKMTGTGDLLRLPGTDDVTITDGIDPTAKNMGGKSLNDIMLFKYYEQNGDQVCDSTNASLHKDDFVPAAYYATISLTGDDYDTFYKPTYHSARFTVVGNYYLVSAGAKDKNTGSVQMISPDKAKDFSSKGYAGGTKLTLKALPNKGYEIHHWIIKEPGRQYTLPASQTIDYSVKSSDTIGDGKIDIQAVLTPRDNTLEYSAKGQGTITVSPAINSGDTILADTRLEFTADPSPGWTFSEWRWTNIGGNNLVSGGTPAADGRKNTKVFRMPDNSAMLYGIFVRDSIDILTQNDLDVSYINNGYNPLYEIGEEIPTDKGHDVPKGVEVHVLTKPGIQLLTDKGWTVTATTPEGARPLEVTEFTSGSRQGCQFTLPEDVTACAVTASTVKGRYSVEAAADDVQFTISVDGNKMDGSTVSDIESGSEVEIHAFPTRGKLLDSWIINGESVEPKDNTYTTTITGNLSVSATTKQDEALSYTLKTDGGGTARYTITDKNGDKQDGTFQGDNTPALTVYKGESIVFETADTDNTITALLVNGEQQELDDGTYTIENASEDEDILCRFRPSTYYNAHFSADTRTDDPIIMDEDGAPIRLGDTLKVPKDTKLKFSVVYPQNIKCVVTADGVSLPTPSPSAFGTNQLKYDYTLTVTSPVEISIADHETMEIHTEEDLRNYFAALVANEDNTTLQPDAILMANLTMNPDYPIQETPVSNGSRFNGNGHSISSMTVGDPQHYAVEFTGLFGNLEAAGSVRDLMLENMTVYANALSESKPQVFANGMLTYRNYGTINNLTLADCAYHVNSATSSLVAALSFDNHGTIEFCKVSNLLIENNNMNSGSAGVVFNQYKDVDGEGLMKGNYFENLRLKYGSDPEKTATSAIVAMDTDRHRGVFTANYFQATPEASDNNATSVYTLEEAGLAMDAPGFVRKVAYTINKATGTKNWGTVTESNMMLPLPLNKACQPPVKVDFGVPDKTLTLYLYPGPNTLPGKDQFGDKTPVAWLVRDQAYAPGQVADLEEDMVITGSSPEDFCASLTSNPTAPGETKYFKTVKDAMNAATANRYLEQELTILKDSEMASIQFTMEALTTLRVKSGVTFTIKADAQIVNKGNIQIEEGAIIQKYGSINNIGTLIIPENALYNYGSDLTNTGTINVPTNIICKPHCCNEWRYADRPNKDGKWPKSSTCKVCTQTITEYLDPDPPENKVRSIEIMDAAEKTLFEVGDNFSNQGLLVIANLTDDTRAVIQTFDMTQKSDDTELPIKNGEPLTQKGDSKIIIHYGSFTCDYKIEVLNTADLLTLTDTEGEEIKEKEMEPGDELALNASLKGKLPYKTSFLWESKDPAIAGLATHEQGKNNTIIANNPGETLITVTVVDEDGNLVQTINPKTIKISIVSHITSLEISGGDISIDKGDTYETKLNVIPSNTTDKVTWESSDEKVATIDANGIVTGTGGGSATITVTAPNGIQDSRKVTVYEKAKTLTLDPEQLTLSSGQYNTISARVSNPRANGQVEWTTDDSSIAGFYVRDEETGEMKVTDTVTTSLSSDGSGDSDAYVVIAGVGNGNAVIKASVEAETGGSIEKECAVTISDSDQYVRLKHNGAVISGQLMNLAIEGRIIQLAAESSVPKDTLVWSVIDDTVSPVLKVNSNGRVTLLRKGLAAVQVTSATTGATDVCMLRVFVSPDGVTLSERELKLCTGDDYTLKATLEPEDAEGKILWSSSDEEIVTVNKDGQITAKGKGTATITATPDVEGAASATCQVIVTDRPIKIELNETTQTLRRDSTFQLNATLKPAVSSANVIWTSSDPSIAQVSETGAVTGIRQGTATITATLADNASAPATCLVTVCEPNLTIYLDETKFTYDGKYKTPRITVMNGNLTLGKDLTKSNKNVLLVYSGDYKLPGTILVTAIARDWHYGTAKASYTIKVKKPKQKKLKKSGRKITVRWKKLSHKYVTGYQVRYSTNSSMKNATTKRVKKWSATKAKLKNLKKHRKYYVQVRSYVKINGIYYHSKWSKKKSIRL